MLAIDKFVSHTKDNALYLFAESFSHFVSEELSTVPHPNPGIARWEEIGNGLRLVSDDLFIYVSDGEQTLRLRRTIRARLFILRLCQLIQMGI